MKRTHPSFQNPMQCFKQSSYDWIITKISQCKVKVPPETKGKKEEREDMTLAAFPGKHPDEQRLAMNTWLMSSLEIALRLKLVE